VRPLPPPGTSGKITPPPPPVRQAAPLSPPSGIDVLLGDDDGESVSDDELFEDSKI
jgi:hypothetical protein